MNYTDVNTLFVVQNSTLYRSRSCILSSSMIWFFDRDGQHLSCEISRERLGRYRVVITQPDGSESVEEVDEATMLIERSVQLMNSLRNDGWHVA